MEDNNLLDEELTGLSRDFDSPATFSKKTHTEVWGYTPCQHGGRRRQQ